MSDKKDTPVVEPEPKDEHPDIVMGNNVFRWTGKITTQRPKSHTVTEIMGEGDHSRKISYVVTDGMEDVPLEGKCGVCGIETYALVQGDNPHAIEERLAVFARAGLNEPPTIYCIKHDPGAQHRKNGAMMVDREGKPVDGTLVRLH